MRHLSWIVTFPVTLVVVVFAVTNRAEVTVRFWPFPWSIELPVWLLVLGSLLAGFLLGGLATWLASGPRRRRARQTAERARALARQLAELKRQQAATTATAAPGQSAATAPVGSPRPAHGSELERLPGA